MRIAFIGCGFVADYYMQTLRNHPELELAGVMDKDQNCAKRFSNFYSVKLYHSLEEVLGDRTVDIVINLTNPRNHFSVSKACLLSGKHVYSEKPLAMIFSDAQKLVDLAEQKKMYISSAPCNVLGESAQTIWKSLRKQQIGKVRLVYAELDDGLIHRMRYNNWLSKSGATWPYKDEFEVGCTLEHAGYYITWLIAFFGTAKTVTSFSSCLIPDKQTDVSLDRIAPDFSSAIIEFNSGVIARLTCSIVAPYNHGINIIGDEGVLSTEDCWNYDSPVYLTKRTPFALRMEKFPLFSKVLGLSNKKIPLLKGKKLNHRYKGYTKMDFSRGIADLAKAIVKKQPCRISANYSLHVNEIALSIHNPKEMGSPRAIVSSFENMDPMPWAN